MLVRSADVRDAAEKHRFWFLYGEVAENLGDDDTAVKATARRSRSTARTCRR